nr:MAG TPA: GRX family protein [Caudoviricetes sp.]
MNKMILYSTGCPKCNVLKAKLKQKNVDYIENNNVDEMQKMGITTVPMLMINSDLLNFVEAVEYINSL